ncbi:PAS domain S-box protein [Mongoliitalea daihaiensis]|uniref:PAS domain S-box protein n=1 Tax=Mongoliitalea daihaiensis TaxID=2782006 RepID=UPI001F3F1A64|nr:PAS domain S-box protein [Mongoliitalea daihaiensis]UJP63932.1 PAS domain S-box protein [Mongoliitalea daihaiensis]
MNDPVAQIPREALLILENSLLKDWVSYSENISSWDVALWWETRVPEVCNLLQAKGLCFFDYSLSQQSLTRFNGWLDNQTIESSKILQFFSSVEEKTLLQSLESLPLDELVELTNASLLSKILLDMGMSHLHIRKTDQLQYLISAFAFTQTQLTPSAFSLLNVFNKVYHQLTGLQVQQASIAQQSQGLHCVHQLISLGERELPIKQYLQASVEIISSGFQSPHKTGVRILFEDMECYSKNFRPYPFQLIRDFSSSSTTKFSVMLTRDRSFMEMEGFLLDTISKTLGDYVAKKRTILSLEQSELRLNNLVRSQTNFVLRTDLEGIHLYTNDTFDREFGWLYKDIPAHKHNAFESIAPHHHQRTLDIVQKCFKKPGKIFQVELDKPKKGGGFRTTLWEFVCLVDQKGNPYEIQCMGIDITNRKQAERAIAYSESKYKFLFDHSPNGVLLIKEGKFIECNLAAIEMIGGQKKDILGKSPSQLSPIYQPNGIHSEKIENKLLQLISKGENQYFEWVHSKVDGSPLIVDVFASKLTIDGEEQVFVVWDDITGKKASEEKLRKLSMAVEQNPLSIVITNLEGNIEYANSSTFKVTGYSPDELIGKNPRVLKSGLTPNSDHEKLWGTITKGELWQGLLYNRKKCGETYTEKATIGPIKNESGQITHYIAIKEDISEKLQTERNLAISEERFRQITEQSQTVIWEIDLDGFYTFISPAAEKVFGYKPEELIGKKHFYDMHPDNLKENFKEKAIRLVKERITIKDFENPIQTKSGQLIWVTTNATPMMDHQQHIIGYRGSDSDITERKVAEEQLKEQNDRLNAILIANPDLIFILNQEEIIQSFFASNEADLKLPRNQIIGASLLDIFGTDGRLIHAEHLATCLQTQERVTYEYEIEIYEKINYYESRMVPLANNRVLAFVRNITDRVNAEKGLIELNMNLEERVIERTQEMEQAKKEAERANHAKSEFLSRMSHELRTPMNSILGFAQLLEMGELSEKQVKGISQILKSGHHLLDLINEILDISKIDAGKISLSLEPVQLRPILLEMIETVSPLATKNQIQVEMLDCEEFDAFIYADKQRLKQILLNLINNAIKYNHPQGYVKLECHKIFDSYNREKIRILVHDSGFGIAEENFERIFNPFERIVNTHSEIEGTGLGLAVVKKLTEIMRGNIYVESELDKGSTFAVEFEKVKHTDHQLNSLSYDLLIDELRTDSPEATILYVEDNSANLKLVEDILQTARPSLTLISSIYGKQTVQLVKEYKPKVILLDLNLPDIHGSEVIKNLKSYPETKDVPVLVISADAIEEQVQHVLSLGAVAYLTKPINIQSFLTELDQLINTNGRTTKKM